MLDAGRAAHARFATDDALAFAARALRLARVGPERLAALELRASALHAAARGSEALAAYREAIDAAGDTPAAHRLRALAVLLSARYSGTLEGPGDREAALALLDAGLADLDEDAPTFETGALLVGRGYGMPRWGRRSADPAAGRRDAARAVEIAEAIGSGYLLANALEALVWLTLYEGFGRARELGERLLAAADRIPDRDEAHENVVVGAMCLAWGGARAAAIDAAGRAQASAEELSPHRALHAAAAQTICLLPAGRVDELRATTADVLDMLRADRGGLCATAAVGLAGQAVALFEAGETAAARRVVDVLDAAWPSLHGALYPSFVIEVLAPFVPLADARARLAALDGRRTPGAVGIARAGLVLAMLDGTVPPIDAARALGERAQAPALVMLADLAAARDPAAAHAAADALAAYGEPYTAARSLAAVLARLGAPEAAVADRLDAMGARASASAAR